MSKKSVVASKADLDDLMKDINSAWSLAVKNLKKNDDGDDDDSDAPVAPEQDQQNAPEAPAAGGAPGADAQGAPAGAPPADGQEAVAPGADAAGAPGQDPSAQGAPGADAGQDPSAGGQDPAAGGQDPDQQLEQEGQQGQDGELSDEELQQIYGAMDPQELERHYMVLRGILRDQYQKAEAGTEDEKDEDKSAKAAEEMSKSEKDVFAKNKALETQVAELTKSVDGLLKATKILSQPTRKAATTEIEFINKSEGGSASKTPANVQALSKAEIKDALNTLCKTNMTLTKSERDLANRYFISGNNESEVLKLIGAKS